MHDIDRVLLEHPEVAQEGEDEQFLFEDELGLGQHEQFYEQEDELGEQEGHTLEQPGEAEQEHGHALGETAEIELANQVLDVGSEQDLDRFVSDLLRAASDPAGRFARSKTGRQLGGILKQAAVQSLPSTGNALAGRPGPSTRRAVGDAARCFGLEPETVSVGDGEFELGRQFVRFADCATRQALRRFNSGPPQQVARRAVTTAARLHAPGLPLRAALVAAPARRMAMASSGASVAPRPPRPASRALVPRPGPGRAAPARCTACGSPLSTTSGRWVLRGNAVVLLPD